MIMIIYKPNDNEQIEFIPIANYHQGPIKGDRQWNLTVCAARFTRIIKREIRIVAQWWFWEDLVSSTLTSGMSGDFCPCDHWPAQMLRAWLYVLCGWDWFTQLFLYSNISVFCNCFFHDSINCIFAICNCISWFHDPYLFANVFLGHIASKSFFLCISWLHYIRILFSLQIYFFAI